MKIKRFDLTGADSPVELVQRILKVEPGLKPPIPIDDLAMQLDIIAITSLEIEGYEASLVADDKRSNGSILVNKEARGGRRRYAIGHELGHFLLAAHRPVRPGQFLCSRNDMSTWTAQPTDRYAQMEVEANLFAALLLMPPPILRAYLRGLGPDLGDLDKMTVEFGVSKDAAARAYCRHHLENIAVVVVKDGRLSRVYASPNFPSVIVPIGEPVPAGTAFHRPSLKLSASEFVRTLSDSWIAVERGQRAPALFEQIHLQPNGFALIMLWLQISNS
jgi:Zn-dependent peptidase ImmA (M78 family)